MDKNVDHRKKTSDDRQSADSSYYHSDFSDKKLQKERQLSDKQLEHERERADKAILRERQKVKVLENGRAFWMDKYKVSDLQTF